MSIQNRKTLLNRLKTMTAGTALRISFVMLVLVILLWLFGGIFIRLGAELIELCAVYFVLVSWSLLLNIFAFVKATILAPKNVKSSQTTALCVVSIVLALLSCVMLYGVLLGIGEALHSRP